MRSPASREITAYSRRYKIFHIKQNIAGKFGSHQIASKSLTIVKHKTAYIAFSTAMKYDMITLERMTVKFIKKKRTSSDPTHDL